MKTNCVSCDVKLKMTERRYFVHGNFCSKCHANAKTKRETHRVFRKERKPEWIITKENSEMKDEMDKNEWVRYNMNHQWESISI